MNERKILIADDHAIIRLGMKFILDSQFNGCEVDEVEDSKGLFESLERKSYTHLILDLQLQDSHAINIFSSIRSQFPFLSILIYTMSSEEAFGKRLLQMGAAGFLSKQSNEAEVIKALHLFFLGRKYISSNLQEMLLKDAVRSDQKVNPFEQLSEREVAVLHNLLQGKGVKEIAGALDLKSTTVATYKARIFDKLSISNLMDLRSMAELYQF